MLTRRLLTTTIVAAGVGEIALSLGYERAAAYSLGIAITTGLGTVGSYAFDLYSSYYRRK